MKVLTVGTETRKIRLSCELTHELPQWGTKDGKVEITSEEKPKL